MNVKEMRQRIFDQMDYFPDLQQYRDSVVRRLNDRYQELCDSAHWLWIQKETTLLLKKEIKGSSTNTLSITSDNPRKLTTSFTVNTFLEAQEIENTDSKKTFKIVRASNENTLFVDDDFLLTPGSGVISITITSGGSGYTDGESLIIATSSGTGITATAVVTGGVITSITITGAGSNYTSSSTITSITGAISNASNATGTLVVGETAFQNFKIKFIRAPLPKDCVEVLGFNDRDKDRGRLLFVNRRREERVFLDADNTGDPVAIIEDEHIVDEPPTIEMKASAIQGEPGITDTAIHGSIVTTSFVNTSSTLLPNTTYEYKYTIYREGRESPPSESVFVTTPDFPASIFISNLEDTAYFHTASSTTTTDNGMYKHIYRRDITNDGKFILVGTVASNITFFQDNAVFPKVAFHYLIAENFRYTSTTDLKRFENPGPYQYVRFWYTPSEDKTIHIRYHYRPKELSADNDAPVIPLQYHQILVYMTLQDMFLQVQDTAQSQLFERRANQMLVQLRRRYLAREDDNKKFGRFDRRRRTVNVYGVPTIN